MSCASRCPERGLALLDVLAGLVVLLVAVLGLVAAITTSLKGNAQARERAIAVAAAQQRLEGLLVATEADLLAADGDIFAVGGLTQRPDGTPLGQVTVDATQAPLFHVTVLVRWLGPYGDDRLSLDTAIIAASP